LILSGFITFPQLETANIIVVVGIKFYPTTTTTNSSSIMHDRYPYERRWISPDEDSEYSELEGYESSTLNDEEDE